jgi:hypothetical protein
VSGTGHFRGSGHRSQVEEHLGDRLAAFVDGELRDDTRERVQAHLVTCEQCRAEADAQRRLKDAVAGATQPALSAGLLARLQELPGAGPGGPGSGGPFDGGIFGGDLFGTGTGRERGDTSTTAAERMEGFRIHDLTRQASRGRRFAFAAAGAFSMAAIALGGALPLDAAVEGPGPGDAPAGTAATPVTMGGAHSAGRRQPGLMDAPLAGATPVAAHRPAGLPSPEVLPDVLRFTPVPTPEALVAYSVTPTPLPLLGPTMPPTLGNPAR